jgi:hypothetical protein
MSQSLYCCHTCFRCVVEAKQNKINKRTPNVQTPAPPKKTPKKNQKKKRKERT